MGTERASELLAAEVQALLIHCTLRQQVLTLFKSHCQWITVGIDHDMQGNARNPKHDRLV
jgi:hypothetical protein